MIVRHERWLKIRDQFTEEEKVQLRAVVTGESICPPGVTIDGDKLPLALLRKISEAK